jgi:ABC-type uncharacterized transport system substrate-binding protein
MVATEALVRHYDQLPMLAAELVCRKVAVIYATGGAGAPLAAKAATTTIPIVFQLGADPVRIGLVPSLNRPGGNITGVTFLGQASVAKRLELLHEAAPAATTIAFFVNPAAVQVESDIREAESAASVLGVRIIKLAAARCQAGSQCRGPSELYRAVLSRTAAEVARLSKAREGQATAGITDQSLCAAPP